MVLSILLPKCKEASQMVRLLYMMKLMLLALASRALSIASNATTQEATASRAPSFIVLTYNLN